MAGGGRFRADDALALCLAAGLTVVKAAAKAKVGERTVYRRLADPAFRVRLAEARATMMDRALGHLAASSAKAAATLRKQLGDRKGAVRVAAARAILTLGTKLQESVELEARIRALEEDHRQREKA